MIREKSVIYNFDLCIFKKSSLLHLLSKSTSLFFSFCLFSSPTFMEIPFKGQSKHKNLPPLCRWQHHYSSKDGHHTVKKTEMKVVFKICQKRQNGSSTNCFISKTPIKPILEGLITCRWRCWQKFSGDGFVWRFWRTKSVSFARSRNFRKDGRVYREIINQFEHEMVWFYDWKLWQDPFITDSS